MVTSVIVAVLTKNFFYFHLIFSLEVSTFIGCILSLHEATAGYYTSRGSISLSLSSLQVVSSMFLSSFLVLSNMCFKPMSSTTAYRIRPSRSRGVLLQMLTMFALRSLSDPVIKPMTPSTKSAAMFFTLSYCSSFLHS